MSEETEETEERGEGCVEGMRCPQCGNHERFQIGCLLMVDATSEGSSADGIHQAHEWDEESICVCPDCEFRGVVGDFTDGAESDDAVRLDAACGALVRNTTGDPDYGVITDLERETPFSELRVESAAQDGTCPDLGTVLSRLALDKARQLGATTPAEAHTTDPDHGAIVDIDNGDCYQVDVTVRLIRGS